MCTTSSEANLLQLEPGRCVVQQLLHVAVTAGDDDIWNGLKLTPALWKPKQDGTSEQAALLIPDTFQPSTCQKAHKELLMRLSKSQASDKASLAHSAAAAAAALLLVLWLGNKEAQHRHNVMLAVTILANGVASRPVMA
jgi:hypothetical protein